MGAMKLFQTVLVIQLFYALAITLTTYGLAAAGSDLINAQIDPFSEVTDDLNLETVSGELEDSLTRQTNIPVVELGALVFYSGNILLDLMLNFAFAIPEMIGMLVNGLGLLFNLDSYIFVVVELFAGILVMAMYFIGLIQLLTGIRSGRAIE